MEDIAITALQTAVKRTKTKRIRNLPGFFNDSLSNMLDRYVIEESERALLEEA
ncbi:hypothetical protein NLX67_21670 [Domibacillus sp. A3M-37]|uniref:hypothetical protein n=1 Tax=Domibacillus sp. A3M-37 TaxID=2962037 RepID=UPI0020B6C481|nr:hypothetical protein [Domibacillus sp. A3M-37]MCP3764926.1 hypothetical protein [Domibacillus sp. A3M-37]